MGRESNIIKSSVQLFASNTAISVISFLALVYFTRELPSSELGSFFLFQALLGVLSIPADFGILGAVEKRVSEGTEPGRVITTALFLIVVPLSLIIITVLLFRADINNYLGSQLASLLAVGIVLRMLKEFVIKVLRGELRVGETASLQLLAKGTWSVLGTILVTLGFGTRGLVYSLLSGFFFVFLWGMYKRETSLGLPGYSHARSIIDYAKFNVISSVGSYVYNWMDVAVLGLFVAPSLVSAYEVAWRVSALLIMVSKAIATSLFPEVSLWDANGAQNQIESTVPRMILYSLVFVVPGVFGISLLAEDILTIVFKPEYAVAGTVLVILSIERVFHSIHAILGRTLNAINQPKLSAQSTLMSLLLNLVLNFILVWNYGILGAAVATGLSFSANTIIHKIYLTNFVSLTYSTTNLIWVTTSSFVMAILLTILLNIYLIKSLFDLLFVVAAGAVLYFTFLCFNSNFRREVGRFLAEIG